MVDRYVRSQGRKLSREAPVPVADFISEELVLGGAANLANNLVALGAKVRVLGVVGNDEPRKWLQEELEKKGRSEEHTSELQSLTNLVCRLLLEKKKKNNHDN